MAKPTVEVFVDCPHCQSMLEIKVFKERLNKPEPAEYDITTNVRVEKQGRLFKEDKQTPGAKVEKKRIA